MQFILIAFILVCTYVHCTPNLRNGSNEFNLFNIVFEKLQNSYLLANPTQWIELHNYCSNDYPIGQLISVLPLDVCYTMKKSDIKSFMFKASYYENLIIFDIVNYNSSTSCSGYNYLTRYNGTENCQYNSEMKYDLYLKFSNSIVKPNANGLQFNYYSDSSCGGVYNGYNFAINNVIYYNILYYI